MATNFGLEIRAIRSRAGETTAQTATAIGITRPHLTKIELGQDRPTERVALALFRHFSLNRNTALRLWSLAGFTSELVTAEDYTKKKEQYMSNLPANLPTQNPPASISVDPTKPTYYTDSIFINSSDFGLVIDFARKVGPEQHFVVTSVGMSFDHAKKLVEVLNDHLQKHER
jgi:DNA-binding XRE family transcriptional regulator